MQTLNLWVSSDGALEFTHRITRCLILGWKSWYLQPNRRIITTVISVFNWNEKNFHWYIILQPHLYTYLEICAQKICSVRPRDKSWAGPGVASQRSADAVGASLRAGEEPRWERGGSSSLGTPGPGSDRWIWPAVEPGNCSLRHLSSGWSNLKPSGGWGPRLLEGSL